MGFQGPNTIMSMVLGPLNHVNWALGPLGELSATPKRAAATGESAYGCHRRLSQKAPRVSCGTRKPLWVLIFRILGFCGF